MERRIGLEEYDVKLLGDAKRLVEKVHTYHYGDSRMRSEIKRLETIIAKIDFLIEHANEEPIDLCDIMCR